MSDSEQATADKAAEDKAAEDKAAADKAAEDKAAADKAAADAEAKKKPDASTLPKEQQYYVSGSDASKSDVLDLEDAQIKADELAKEHPGASFHVIGSGGLSVYEGRR